MSINLSNVNISLNEFQRLSQGEYNAGEVKLAGETKLAKMNNHVGSFFVNKDIISHEEVIAIKQALVKALSQNGVDADELASTRKELGIASADASDRDLRHRSIMPLTRQQIREILDRNAAKINDFNAANHGSVYISKLSQLHQAGPAAKSAQVRNAVNAKLAEGNRQVNVNEDLLRLQAIVSDFDDFVADRNSRKATVAMAREQLAALMQSCNDDPSPDEPAVAKLELPNGRTTSIPTGLSQKAFAGRLENIIVRYTGCELSPVENAAVQQYRELQDDNARTAFLAGLADDPDGGLKARALAVRCLYSRGISDYATLNIANRLNKQDAIKFATALLAMPKESTPDQIRANPVFVEMSAKEPDRNLRGQIQAYIPATSNAQYNHFVKESLGNSPEKLLPAHRNLAMAVMEQVRTRLGTVAMPENAQIGDIIDNARQAGLAYGESEAAWEARRSSVANIRESYLAEAFRHGALKILDAEMDHAIRALGGNPAERRMAANGMRDRYPEFFQRLAAAESPAKVQEILAGFKTEIEQMARLYCKVKPFEAGIEERMRQRAAEKLGVSRAAIGDERLGIFFRIRKTGTQLMDKILCGEVPANTDEEIEKAFTKLMDETIDGLMGCLRQVDGLKPPLPPHVADQVKAHIFDMQKFDRIDVGHIVKEAQKRINTEHLENLLQGNGDRVQIQQELQKIHVAIMDISVKMMAGKKEIGPDEWEGIRGIAGVIAIRSRPGLADKLDAFYMRPDVKSDIENNNLNAEVFSITYLREYYSFHPDVSPSGPEKEAKMRRLFSEPREMAAFTAAGGEPAAFQTGYHAKDMPMLARAFTLFKAATGCTDDDAMRAVLDPQSKARRVASYGGRFTKSAESFGKGLALIDRFDRWFQAFVSDVNAGNRDTLSKLNIYGGLASPKCARAMEKFILEEIACNAEADLDEENAGNLFDMEHNKAMRFVGRGYAEDSTIRTLAAIPPEKRGLVYDVFAILDGPLGSTRQEVDAKTPITSRSMTLSRVLRQYDELEEMRSEGQLSRERLVEMLFGDFGVAPDAGNRQINNACFEKFAAKPQNLWDPIQAQLDVTGASFDECAAAIDEGRRLDIQRHVGGIATYNGIESLGGGIENALKTFTKDLNRASGANSLPGGEPLLDAANVCFTFKFPGEQSVSIHTAAKDDPVVVEKTSDIVGRVNSLCGSVHTEQLSSVYYALSQNGVCKNIKNGFSAQNIFTDEHTAMTFTLSKDNATGAVTIAYNEPAGFPFKFHWTTTVALDGTITSTPMVVEHPQQPQPANP